MESNSDATPRPARPDRRDGHGGAAGSRTAMTRVLPATPAGRFLLAASLLLACVTAAALALAPDHRPAAVVGPPVTFALAVLVAAATMRTSYPHPRVGLCNLVTLSRLALAATLTVPLLMPGALATDARLAWSTVAIAAVALSLDGIDGWLARRSGLASAYGARFDMEVDSILALLLALLAFQSGKAGIWVLALGGMRYAFVIAGLLRPRLSAPLPERFGRKAVCVLQIATLVALLAPVVTPPASVVLAAIATAALVWSFAVDLVWLERRGA